MSEDQPRPPLPWETKVAIGALTLLSLQELHELYLFSVHSRTLGAVSLEAGNAVLLLLTLGILFGLFERSRLAWWVGIVVFGGIGALLLETSWPRIQATLHGHRREVFTRVDASVEYEWLEPYSLKPFQAFWVIAKITLLLTVPGMLLLGKLREQLRRG